MYIERVQFQMPWLKNSIQFIRKYIEFKIMYFINIINKYCVIEIQKTEYTKGYTFY